MTPTDAMVEAARKAFGDELSCRVNMRTYIGDIPVQVIREATDAALTAALAVSGYGEVVEALRNLDEAFCSRHGCFPLDRVTQEQRQWNDAMIASRTALSRLTPAIANTIVSQGN